MTQTKLHPSRTTHQIIGSSQNSVFINDIKIENSGTGVKWYEYRPMPANGSEFPVYHSLMQCINMAVQQATMGGLHHQNSLHSHHSQGDTPGHLLFVCGASNDELGQFQDL